MTMEFFTNTKKTISWRFPFSKAIFLPSRPWNFCLHKAYTTKHFPLWMLPLNATVWAYYQKLILNTKTCSCTANECLIYWQITQTRHWWIVFFISPKLGPPSKLQSFGQYSLPKTVQISLRSTWCPKTKIFAMPGTIKYSGTKFSSEAWHPQCLGH